MQPVYFTAGPSQLHPKLGTYMNDALAEGVCSISHRSKKFDSLFEHTTSSLRKLLNIPQTNRIFFIGSATEAMERFLQNCVEARSFHFVNGAFSKRFFETGKELGKKPDALTVADGEGFDLASATVPSDAEAVCITHNETATGVSLPVADIHALKQKHPDKLFAVDIVSSAPSVGLDFSLIDCAFFSVQKGFGMPAGLGVMIVNEACLQKARALQAKGMSIGTFHSLLSLEKYAAKSETPETPNVLGIYLLGRVVDDYLERGIENMRRESASKAKLVYDFFEKHKAMKPFVKEPKWRSETVIVIETPAGSEVLVGALKEKGLIVSRGYGAHKDAHIRIPNFPAHSRKDVERLLEAIGA